MLGVTVSSDLMSNAHVNTILRKGRQGLYKMYQLKRSGVSQKDLMTEIKVKDIIFLTFGVVYLYMLVMHVQHI